MIPRKTYLFMIMVHWNDNSEFIIYRDLSVIRSLIKQIERIAPSSAVTDLQEAARSFKKRNIFGDNRLRVHINLLEPLQSLFSVMEYYKPILANTACTAFLYKR